MPPGSYRLQLTYFGFWIGKYQTTSCDSLVLEFAIAPLTSAQTRVSHFSCPSQETIPQIDFSNLTPSGFSYDSTNASSSTVFNVQGISSSNIRLVRWLQSYNLTIPDTDQINSVWSFEAGLSTEFLSGGSIGLVLIERNNETTSPPNLNCVRYGSCSIGQRISWNRYVLLSSVVPGDYTLWLFEKPGEKDSNFTPCIPFSMNVRITEQEQEETLLTCGDVRPLPKVLLPGYDSPANSVHFADYVLMDGAKNVHSIAFSVSSPSYFRVRTSQPTVDIDLRLINSDTNALIAGGYRFGPEEAIVAYLQPANYSLSIVYFGVYQFHSCDSF